MELLTKLDNYFKTRYSKVFVELNATIYPTEKDDKGLYTKPAIGITAGGGTVFKHEEKVELTNPAKVNLELKKFKPFSWVYRISIPRDEAQIAHDNPAYFNYLMDNILNIALSNYRATVGEESIVRFGGVYCTAERSDGKIFAELDNHDLELCLAGEWASDEEAS